uniref:hypothetical protein n=1 Tax=Amycolatopsis sp. CA-096443 TaxID=3239919 RepID=UPI003F497D48
MLRPTRRSPGPPVLYLGESVVAGLTGATVRLRIDLYRSGSDLPGRVEASVVVRGAAHLADGRLRNPLPHPIVSVCVATLAPCVGPFGRHR